jgi:hypothetical protein
LFWDIGDSKPTIGYDRKEALENRRWKARTCKKVLNRSALGRENIGLKGGVGMIEKN